MYFTTQSVYFKSIAWLWPHDIKSIRTAFKFGENCISIARRETPAVTGNIAHPFLHLWGIWKFNKTTLSSFLPKLRFVLFGSSEALLFMFIVCVVGFYFFTCKLSRKYKKYIADYFFLLRSEENMHVWKLYLSKDRYRVIESCQMLLLDKVIFTLYKIGITVVVIRTEVHIYWNFLIMNNITLCYYSNLE